MQTYLVTSGDFSDYVVVALLQGPDGLDLKVIYKEWMDSLKEITDREVGEEREDEGYFGWRERLHDFMQRLGYSREIEPAGGPGKGGVGARDSETWFAEHLVQRCGFVKLPYTEAVI